MSERYFDSSQRPGNKYRFNCPVTGRQDQLYVLCALRNSKQMRGEKLVDADCACAMNASKCPARRMLRLEWHEERPVFFAADMVPTFRLHPKIVPQIEKLNILPIHAHNTGIDSEGFNALALSGLMPLVGAAHADPRRQRSEQVDHTLDEDGADDAVEATVERKLSPKTGALIGTADMSELLNQAVSS